MRKATLILTIIFILSMLLFSACQIPIAPGDNNNGFIDNGTENGSTDGVGNDNGDGDTSIDNSDNGSNSGSSGDNTGDSENTGDNTGDDSGSNAGDNSGSTGGSSSGTTENLPYSITCTLGTPNAYTVTGSTITFNTVLAQSAYSITGSFNGNIVIDTGDSYKFDLELCGFSLTSSEVNPITILTGDEVSITAKNGYINYIYDKSEAVDPTDTSAYSASIYSLVDLEISGRGTLNLESDNNNGIHSKDDLQVKNLTLNINCADNALKGNDGVEITSANTTLISRKGDAIKSTNSHISTTTGAQKGTISILGGTHNLYSACDGIDSSYDVIIDDETTVLNIFTDKYSEYSEEVTATSESTYYLRSTVTTYKYSVKYYNSDSDYVFVNASDSYETVRITSGRQQKTYYYYTFAKKAGYSKMAIYAYSSSQTQGQDSNYTACSSLVSVNNSYDTASVTISNSALSVSWTNYTTSSSGGGMGGMGGMQEGNSDKGAYSTKGIKASNSITINNGTIFIKAYDDAIHATNDGIALENGVMPTGNLTINGGTITAYSNDDGAHADGILSVTNGTLNITNAYEGVEGTQIKISGGNVYVKSTDDGFNSTIASGAGITISGGNVYVYCTGDGLDSNSSTSKGAMVFSGGNTVVISNSNGNASLDSDGGYTHTGGRLVAIMPNGGMTNEVTNGNTNGMTTKTSLSLSANGYLTVAVSSSVVLAVKMPCSLTAHVVYLGASNASISSATSVTNTLNENGVYWA